MTASVVVSVVLALICIGVIAFAFYGRNQQDKQWAEENNDFFAFDEEDAP